MKNFLTFIFLVFVLSLISCGKSSVEIEKKVSSYEGSSLEGQDKNLDLIKNLQEMSYEEAQRYVKENSRKDTLYVARVSGVSKDIPAQESANGKLRSFIATKADASYHKVGAYKEGKIIITLSNGYPILVDDNAPFKYYNFREKDKVVFSKSYEIVPEKKVFEGIEYIGYKAIEKIDINQFF